MQTMQRASQHVLFLIRWSRSQKPRRSFDRSGFRPEFSYKPAYTGHGIDLSGLRLEDQAYGRNLYGGFQVPELDISQSECERPEKEPKEW